MTPTAGSQVPAATITASRGSGSSSNDGSNNFDAQNKAICRSKIGSGAGVSLAGLVATTIIMYIRRGNKMEIKSPDGSGPSAIANWNEVTLQGLQSIQQQTTASPPYSPSSFSGPM